MIRFISVIRTGVIDGSCHARIRLQTDTSRSILLLASLSSLCTFDAGGLAALGGTNWPQLRGRDSRGIADNPGLAEVWSATKNIARKTNLPGRGWSSPIVWWDRVFLTTVVNTGPSEEPKKGLYFGGDRPSPPDSVHQWKVFCLDLHNGDIMWERQLYEGRPLTAIHLKNSFASETPVTDGERVYCYFGNLGVFCLDVDGNEIWKYVVDVSFDPLRVGNGCISRSPQRSTVHCE